MKRENFNQKFRRGQVYYADLDPVIGSEQGGMRPVVILQNDTGNHYSPTVICAPITSRRKRAHLPTHVALGNKSNAIQPHSVILLEQLRTLDKQRLVEYVGLLDTNTMACVNSALAVSLSLE